MKRLTRRLSRIDPFRAAGWALVLLFCTFTWAAVGAGIATVARVEDERPHAAPEEARVAPQLGPDACACPEATPEENAVRTIRPTALLRAGELPQVVRR